MKQNKFSFSKTVKSFGHAINGLKWVLKNESNARIHFSAAIAVIILSFVLELHAYEWVAVLLCIGMTISAEAFNTALEQTCNYIQPEKHPMIKTVKDIAAGSVLVTAVISALVACVIFIPKIILLLN